MDTSSKGMLEAVALLGWAGVGAYGIWELAGQDAGDGWERPYVLFTVALLAALGGSTTAAWAAAGPGKRRGVHTAGAAVATLAIASSLVAWAVPLWATLLAAASALFAVAAPEVRRPGLMMLAGAPVVGTAVAFAATVAEFGRQDSYGDYPAAFGLGTTIIAVGSAFAVGTLARQRRTDRPSTGIATDPGASATA